jgi:hypothetical protein
MLNKMYTLLYGMGIGGSVVYLNKSHLAKGNDTIVGILLIVLILCAIYEIVVNREEEVK